MRYEANIIRPPNEANSILLQKTVGCSRNKCTFFGAYKGKRFRIKANSIIMADIAFAANFWKRQRRVFLFHANHASNYLPIKACLPKDEVMTPSLIDETLLGKVALKPEYLSAF